MSIFKPKSNPQPKPSLKSHRTQPPLSPLKSIKNIIAIGSGKGGVGKSTLTAHLAQSLSYMGYKTGILDADIYGPSIPELFNKHEDPTVNNKQLTPLQYQNKNLPQSKPIDLMSIGNLIDMDKAIIWRGPMVSKALQQMLNDTLWNDLDILLVDLPPGTGDIQLTLAQKIPTAGAIIITTPQDLSLIDAQRATQMFQKTQIPILGIIENMSLFTCPNCHTQHPIFGQGAADKLAQKNNLNLLGQLPLDSIYRENIFNLKSNQINSILKTFEPITQNIINTLSNRPIDYGNKFGEIKVK